MSADLRIGVDIGGTFTDVVVRRPGAPSRIMKIPTTRGDPSILNGRAGRIGHTAAHAGVVHCLLGGQHADDCTA